ncbi:transcription-repair coupling factor [candidate division KSB1 bacterium]|nr:transcription-repair coupling factor [candidate division KSB1 bacterium]NIR72464.1 transcription-repair coupling factor [candidate division KSB1 bacterium]NIS24049.1 transcription-repair coupling factor [candidate division KSB1 bacterium]NIT70968.1 transcription-repair coupling factor [candidate division KSB1 bacterium]NIU27379.1 transcription-repair coupling factor [candidate division KSB1 bacterium]
MKVVQSLKNIIQSSPSVIQTNELLSAGEPVNLKGVVGALKSFLLSNFFETFSTQIVFIGSDLEEVEAIQEDLQNLLNDESVNFFTGEVRHKYGLYFSNNRTKSSQLSTLEALTENRPAVLVSHASGLLLNLPTTKDFLDRRISISGEESPDFQELIGQLSELGFVREERVDNPGEVSVRGGIIDVFPHSSEHPYRIEFWGDEVESIRTFDPITQRSLKEDVRKIELFPQDIETEPQQNKNANDIFDFLHDDAIVVLDEPDLIRKQIDPQFGKSDDFALKEVQQESENGRWGEIRSKMQRFRQVSFVSFDTRVHNVLDLSARSQDSFKGNLKLLGDTFQKFNKEKLDGHQTPPKLYFLCDNPSQTERMQDIFEEENILVPNLATITLGLHKGFAFPEGNLVVFTDHEFYGRAKRLRLPKHTFKGLTPKQFRTLNVGDYVVHVDFGIGIFRGLKKIPVGGHERECLHLEYKGGDNLYVRFERMDRVHKYSTKDGMTPTLSKLGSADWQRLKHRTKKKIKDIADELIKIYAARKARPGHAFGEDTLWQRELEASFPYEDTPDQVKATVEVKKDMESQKPMDRLVCGDVGFGKTEIAVRAAFKSVLSGKQAAMLVPTTILAHQHYHTFKQRLEKFPVMVEMLSRFRTRAEQQKIVEDTQNGKIDMLIGTHRILSKDVNFKDLGLLIVDEEQRFGVRHKERLKKLKANIDVLTLTATPIPRTLHLSLLGARDITNINTPPKNRLPIVTEILPFNKLYIREVVLNELERGGQVFFVHNRVRTIERVATMLSAALPEARVVVAHGQMPEKELEQVMIDFMEKNYEILVSTMIIESGLDMPNVNTIIVNRADKLGLAQLYQLRGRVGRSHQRAYAYLLIPPIETLTDEAMKRLRAIEEFSEIGSGSQLAMRDLEIRGAGNLLGAEQSGYIDALGFDMYNKILDEAVKELQNEQSSEEPAVPEIETQIEAEMDAYLPESYINSGSERVDVYKRLIESNSLKQIDEIVSELQDRFGRLPEPVENLTNYLALRIIGKRLGLTRVEVKGTELVVEFTPTLSVDHGEPFKKWLGTMVENAIAPFEFIQNEGVAIRLKIDQECKNQLVFVKEFLQSLKPK